MVLQRPFVFICSGMSLDGKITNYKKQQSQIATDDDWNMLLDGRVQADAILIGANQLRLDDPKLTVKTEERNLQRLSLGKTWEPTKVAVVSDLGTIVNREGDFFRTGEDKILFTTQRTSEAELDYFKRSAQVYVIGKIRVDLAESLRILHALGYEKVLVEGGGELNYALLAQGLVDEVHLKIGNLVLGGRKTVTFMEGEGFAKGVKMRFLDVDVKPNYIIVRCKPEYDD